MVTGPLSAECLIVIVTAELMRDVFFKPVLDKGGQMARHNNTVASAENVIRLVLYNHPLPLRIYRCAFA